MQYPIYLQRFLADAWHRQAPLSGTLVPGWNRSHHCAGSHGHLPSPGVGHREEIRKQRNDRTGRNWETGRTGSASVILSVAMWLFYGFGQLIRHSSNVNLFAIIETFDLYIGGPVDLASCVHVILLYTLQARLQRYPHSWIFMVIPDHSSPSDFFGVSTPKDLRLCRLILFGVLFGCAADAVVMVSPVGASQW